MAEDTREIVYYKGKEYYVNRKGDLTSDIELVSSKSITLLVMTDKLLTPQEYEKQKTTRLSTHIKW